MTLYIWLIFSYEVFGNVLTEFARRSMSSPAYSLSNLERRLWKENSAISLTALIFLFATRINGIVFLIYLGFRTVWWHPIAIWLGCLVATAVVVSMLRRRTGLAIPALMGFVVLPISGTALWTIV